MARGIDHLVLPVHDLALAVARYQALGFTVTPRAVHPFGTANALIQLQACFLELLEVDDAAKIPASETPPSFAQFNRDFLSSAEGFSMLVLEAAAPPAEAAEPSAEAAAFARAGLAVRPFYFERDARGADGIDRPVAFTLHFANHGQSPMAGFFTCHHHAPQNFWWPEYQTHANRASRIDEVVISTPALVDSTGFIEKFAGAGAMQTGDREFTLDTGRGRIRLVEPADLADAGQGPRLAAFTLGGLDLAELAGRAKKHGITARQTEAGLVFDAEVMYGVAITMRA